MSQDARQKAEIKQFIKWQTLIVIEGYMLFECIITASPGVGIEDESVAYRGLGLYQSDNK
jgi:hypothetical protein